jgi:hypothetical protein
MSTERDTVTCILSAFRRRTSHWGEVGNFTLSVRDLKALCRDGDEGDSAALNSPASARRVAAILRDEGHIVPVERNRHGVVTLWTAA